MRALITCRQMQSCMDEFQARFDDAGIEVVQPSVVQQLDEHELAEMIGGFEGMIAGDDPLTAGVIERADRMRVISKWGVGTDGIDVEAARARGILVTRTPNVFGDEVADVAIGYLVMLARQLHRLHNSVASGDWLKVEGMSLSGKTLGIIGLGDIGRAVARRGAGFGMRLVGYDVADVSEALAGLDLKLADLPTLWAESDAVVLCCPLTPETHHLVDGEALSASRLGVLVINVARGPLIDEIALVEALASGRVAAAALDVFEREPLPADSPLRSFESCVFGTHNGSNTVEANLRASARAVDNLLDGLAG